MSRKGWRVSRAIRVLLACLALWLPARTASAAFAPADTVVMVAGAAQRAARAAAGESRPANRNPLREARALPARAAAARFVVARLERVHRPIAVNRSVVERRYLRHCALLR